MKRENLKRVLLTALWAVFAACASAQTDVTKYYLENYGFDDAYDYEAGATTNVSEEIKDVKGWTADLSAGYTIVGTYEFGFKGMFNTATVPDKGYDGEAGGGLAISTGWGQTFLFYQNVTLPAGTYTLNVPTYNGSGDKTAATSQVAWIPTGGTAVKSKVTSYPTKAWTQDQITFTLTATTTGKIQFGMKAAEGGSANSAKLVVDYVQLLGQDMDVQAVKTQLEGIITTAKNYYGEGQGNGAAALKSAIDAAQATLDSDAAELTAVLDAIQALKAAIEAYRQQNISEENPQDNTSLIVNPSFEEGTSGWTVAQLSSQSNSAFKKKAGSTYLEKWTGSGSVGDGSVMQTLTALPNGVYKLTASAQNYTEKAATTQNSGAYIFADDEQTPVYGPDDYSVKFTSITGEAKIGFVADGATGNWIAVDNFRLYLIGYLSADDVMAEVKRLCDAAEGMTLPEEIADTYELSPALTAAVQTARGLTTASTETEVSAAVKALKAAMAAEALLIDKALLAYNIAHATEGSGTAPKVTVTHPYVATGATQALMRATMTGSDVLERGVCWSTERQPTVLDQRTTDYYSLKGNIYHVTGLTPATVYYLRPYVMNKTYQVAYGDEVKIVTHPAGTCTSTWDNGAPDAAANSRCLTAIEQTIDYFNEWTGIMGFTLQGHYGSDTPTADCSYGGWMRIGPNAAYQAIGTVLHETGHGVGVGTHWRWYNCADTRENTTYGKWLGREANRVLHFLENTESEQIAFTGDGVHGWGTVLNPDVAATQPNASISFDWLVNGADKDKHQEIQYIGGMCILYGLFIDGLCPTSAYANGIAGYTYNFDDRKKYYLMCKSQERGLGAGVMYQRNLAGSNVSVASWRNNLTEEALNDSAAWTMEFNPSTGCYLFKNVASGMYLSHPGSLLMKQITAEPGTTEQFQLMPDRTDVTIGSGADQIATHGYWLTWSISTGSKSVSANAFTASGYGSVVAADFDYSNAATAQQWIIISEDEIENYRAIAAATGIRPAVGDNAHQNAAGEVYSADGIRMSGLGKGVNIVRRADGTYKKVVVR